MATTVVSPQRGWASRASSTTASTCTGSAGSVIWSHMSATLPAIYADPVTSPSTVATRVIACLDVDAGRVVKGVNFANLRDAGDPVEMASVYDAEGADELVFLDITASSSSRETTYDVVRRTAEQVSIPLTVGG